LEQRHSPFVEWSYLRVVNLEALRGARSPQLAQYLENLPYTSNSAVLTEKLADYYEQLGKPSSAIATLQKALERNPSPQQRIRIRLTLGEKLLAQDSIASALDDYRKLVEESPDYPGRSAINEKIKSLEERLHGTNAPAK
jgi:tetratricopeptide (TPR) repeat protein